MFGRACLKMAAMLRFVCKIKQNQLVKSRPQARARRPAGSLRDIPNPGYAFFQDNT